MACYLALYVYKYSFNVQKPLAGSVPQHLEK